MTNTSTHPDKCIGNVTPDACPHCGSNLEAEVELRNQIIAKLDRERRNNEAEVEEWVYRHSEMEAACASHMTEVERLKKLLHSNCNDEILDEMNTEKQKAGVKKFFSPTPRTDAEPSTSVAFIELVSKNFAKKLERELAELWSRFDKQMQAEAEASNLKAICDEQQETLKFWGKEIEELRLEVIAAQESEAVWKTERDKADQRRLEAEAEVERLKEEVKSLNHIL